MKIDGDTKIIGFLGSTYKTSKMYRMYNAAFKFFKFNYVYVPFIVSDLRLAIDGIRNLGIHALGITIPFKTAVLPFLDELDPDAKRIGAVNTVINQNGKLVGYNTDGKGAMKAIREVTTIKNKNVILLGAGGAARAIAFAVKDEKGKLTVINRTEEHAARLAKEADCESQSLSRIGQSIKEADIVINSTSVGMAPKSDVSLINRSILNKRMTVMDLVTNPSETKLLKDAEAKGCQKVYGARMLFWQAVLKFKIFTGVDAPLKVMEEALYA